MKTLKGRVALVTGASGAMGRAVVEALVAQDCRIGMVDVDREAVGASEARFGDVVHAVACDIGDAQAVAAAHAEVVETLGRVDILVNNAGVLTNHKLEATTGADWRRVMAANLDGALFWSRAVLPPMMAAAWGRIVNVSSLAAKTGGLTAGTAYSVSKRALGALTFSLARDLAAFGVTANAIAPAYVRTSMVTEQFVEAQRQTLLKQIPVGRFCEPEEFADVVCSLASPLSGFITGEVIELKGGLLID